MQGPKHLLKNQGHWEFVLKLLLFTAFAILGSTVAWPLAILHLQQSGYPPKAIAILVGVLIAVLVLASQRIHFAWTELGKVWFVAQLLMVGALIHHLPESPLEKLGFLVVSLVVIFRMILDLGADIRRLAQTNPNPMTWYSSTFITLATLALIGQMWWATFLMHGSSFTWETVLTTWGNIGRLLGITLVLVGLLCGRSKTIES